MRGDWHSLTEEKIQTAIKNGKFDNLKGAGKPFDWDDENPFEDQSMRPAYALLKSNGFTLPWIEEKRSIEAEAAYQVEALERALLNYQRMALEDTWWQTRVAQFKQEMTTLNQRILTLNIQVPNTAFQMRRFNIDHLLAEVEATSFDS